MPQNTHNISSTNYQNTFWECYDGFNGKEMGGEIYGDGNATTAMFWEYDTRLARRWNLDPKPQVSISDYACFGNNPIWFSDVLGDKFGTKRDKKRAGRVEKTARVRTGILEEQLKNTSLSDEERADLNAQIEDLKNVSIEISEMRNAETVFTFKRVRGGQGAGLTTMDDNGTIILRFSGFGLSCLAHEMKHGYQALKGDLNFSSDYSKEYPGEHNGGFLYDATDEVEAYRRTYAFGNKEYFDSYTDITSDKISSLYNPITHKYPYETLSKSSLSISNYTFSTRRTPRAYYTKEIMLKISFEYYMLHKIKTSKIK